MMPCFGNIRHEHPGRFTPWHVPTTASTTPDPTPPPEPVAPLWVVGYGPTSEQIERLIEQVKRVADAMEKREEVREREREEGRNG